MANSRSGNNGKNITVKKAANPKGAGYPKRTRVEILEDREVAFQMECQHYTQREIRDFINKNRPKEKHITQQQICSDLKYARDEFMARPRQNTDEVIKLELKKLDIIEAELFREWRDSKKNFEHKERQTYQKFSKPNSKGEKNLEKEVVREKVIVRSKTGNVNYLDSLDKIRIHRAKLLGLTTTTIVRRPGGEEEETTIQGEGVIVFMPDNGRNPDITKTEAKDDSKPAKQQKSKRGATAKKVPRKPRAVKKNPQSGEDHK